MEYNGALVVATAKVDENEQKCNDRRPDDATHQSCGELAVRKIRR